MYKKRKQERLRKIKQSLNSKSQKRKQQYKHRNKKGGDNTYEGKKSIRKKKSKRDI